MKTNPKTIAAIMAFSDKIRFDGLAKNRKAYGQTLKVVRTGIFKEVDQPWDKMNFEPLNNN